MTMCSLNTNYLTQRKTIRDAQNFLRAAIMKSNQLITNGDQTQRRTATPFTITVLQAATGGRRTTTAPAGPAQPARTTPRAQTTALASEKQKNDVRARRKTPITIESVILILSSRSLIGFSKEPPEPELKAML